MRVKTGMQTKSFIRLVKSINNNNTESEKFYLQHAYAGISNNITVCSNLRVVLRSVNESTKCIADDLKQLELSNNKGSINSLLIKIINFKTDLVIYIDNLRQYKENLAKTKSDLDNRKFENAQNKLSRSIEIVINLNKRILLLISSIKSVNLSIKNLGKESGVMKNNLNDIMDRLNVIELELNRVKKAMIDME
ncbi:hypothetical protein GF327_01835 [Candidatus Woesearchaeota archaeon]|nr:hypothetical protein [Candidatus Woesearchaeota archaeon]